MTGYLTSGKLPSAFFALALMAGLVSATTEAAEPSAGPATGSRFVFRDAGDQAGAFPHLAGIIAHAAAWGDVDNDGWIDLYVGNFHKAGSKPNLLLRNVQGKFRLDDQPSLKVSARSSGAVFADLDNDGDLDFYLSNLGGGASGPMAAPNCLFRNEGGGKFADVSAASGACPAEFRGRSVTVLDFDGDGLLDLLAGESIGYGSAMRSRLFRNRGDLRFDDVSDVAGVPAGIPGLGVAAGDVDNDGWPDICLAAKGGNRLFLNDRRGRFREAHGTAQVLANWAYKDPDDTTAGVCFGDVNRDGLLDIVIGQHFDHPWREPIAVRLYLNRGSSRGHPAFEDVTEAAGLEPLPMKGPHVEVQDFDNDGWADLYVSVAAFAQGNPRPVIYRNLGVRAGLPRFREDALSGAAAGDPRDKTVRDTKITYSAAAPSGDYDNDGRLDLLLSSWWADSRSLLLHNETPAGNWLQVQVEGGPGVNRMGVGAKVKIYASGKLADGRSLLGCQEIAAACGYCSGQPALAHFGLGTADRVDLQVVLPHGKGVWERRGVRANQRIVVSPHDSAPRAAAEPRTRSEAAPNKKAARKEGPELSFPPALPDGKTIVTDSSPDFLKPAGTLRPGVTIAKAAPTIDFLYYPGQDYPGKPWSNWGDGVAVEGRYYSAIGDHLSPQGNALVFEYDLAPRTLRPVVEVKKVLNRPEGHYVPGKIHGRLDVGGDGCLYFATHRGSSRTTTDEYHYQGDWILRYDPGTGKTDVVAHAPVAKHCIPCTALDPARMVFYGGTAAGKDAAEPGVQFFAYDLRAGKVLYHGPDGPPRYMAFAGSTGRVYYTPAESGEGPLMRYDPKDGDPPVKLPATLGIRAATQETPQGILYAVSHGVAGAKESTLYAINTKSEEVEALGPAAVGEQTYITSLDADPAGRYLYYIPGAHGGAEKDGTPVVQFDVKTRRKKVIAFLHPFYRDKYEVTPVGTFSTAISPRGDVLYVTWNANRGGKAWDCCALTVIHLPESERLP